MELWGTSVYVCMARAACGIPTRYTFAMTPNFGRISGPSLLHGDKLEVLYNHYEMTEGSDAVPAKIRRGF